MKLNAAASPFNISPKMLDIIGPIPKTCENVSNELSSCSGGFGIASKRKSRQAVKKQNHKKTAQNNSVKQYFRFKGRVIF